MVMITLKQITKKALVFGLKRAGLFSRFQLSTSGYLYKMGWFESYRAGMPINANGLPIPWMTYAAIYFLGNRIHPEMEVFEYSCGNSTLWWSTRVKNIISCEHDREWFERMKSAAPSNASLHHIELEYGGAYSQKISEYRNKFDVIVIDGRDRVNCAKNCLSALKENGVVVWDNSDRDEYCEGYNYLKANGFRRLDFSGMGPVNLDDWCTSIFYRSNNCLGL
jgi:hypothetical protein